MRERLLGSSGADLSRVYFMHEDGRLYDVASASVFHWDDLDGVSAAMVEREGSSRGAVGHVAVSFADLLVAWQFVQALRAGVGLPVGAPVPLACPICGGDDVVGDGAETGENDTASEWVTCSDCGSSWEDIYALVARDNVRAGSRVDIATARPETSADVRRALSDWVDMAYEDRTDLGDEGRIYSGGWQS